MGLTVVQHELEFLEGDVRIGELQHGRVGQYSDVRGTAGLQRVQAERLTAEPTEPVQRGTAEAHGRSLWLVRGVAGACEGDLFNWPQR